MICSLPNFALRASSWMRKGTSRTGRSICSPVFRFVVEIVLKADESESPPPSPLIVLPFGNAGEGG